MFTNNFDPVAFTFFFIDIRWYSLSYILGILLGWLYIKRKFLKNNNLSKLFDNYISYLILGIIFGGRLGYIIFYNLNYYLLNPLEIFFLWQGGMSFHGGVIGVITTTYIFCKKKKINPFLFLDLVSLTAPIGIFFGRVSNFVNSELYGRITDIPWSVKFLKIDNESRHPSQLYEAIFEGIILFIILNCLKVYLKTPGKISCLFLIFYSIFRFFIEFTREPDSHIGLLYLNLSLGQLISIITILFALLVNYKISDEKI